MLRGKAQSPFIVDIRPFLTAKRVQERCSCRFQLLLQPRRAIAAAARPRLASVLIAAFAPVVRILHFREIEVFLPVRPLFLQWCGAVTDFHPTYRLVVAETSLTHIAQIFAFGDRALAERLLLDRLKQIAFAAGFNAGSNQVTDYDYRFPTAAQPAPASRETVFACACRWTAPPACHCGRKRNSSGCPQSEIAR